MVCGAKLIYGKLEKTQCHFCGQIVDAEVICGQGHFVCDGCHQQKPLAFLERYFKQTELKDPVAMLEEIFAHPGFPLHGPEHHFLLPLVTLKSMENSGIKLPANYQELTHKRCAQLPGGTCGHWGACAAALGAGITSSIFAKVTPLNTQFYGM
ncbi:MAG: radical SAM protein, partial [Spirochaetae bacterium HGW-Spirochaetae-6]